MNTLLVIVSDNLAEIDRKGELSPRYYNPGDLFDTVHILATNEYKVDPARLQLTVGSAKLYIHNLPTGRKLFFSSLGWRPRFLKRWALGVFPLVREINPSLIRCYGNSFNAYLASQIKESLGVPYIVSLHINPDVDIRSRALSFKQRLTYSLIKSIEYRGLKNADKILPVYESIIPYINKMNVNNFKVVYNILNKDFLKKKEDYKLHKPVRIISVGRQIAEKNPENLIRALKSIPQAHLTLVGNGSYHEHLKSVIDDYALNDKVQMIPSMRNNELCSRLADFDIFATHSDYWEISKSVLEPLLVGLPVVINKRNGAVVPELEKDFIVKVENTEQGYCQALNKLIEDHNYRENIGRAAYKYSQENWSPDKMEEIVVGIYRSVLKKEAGNN